MTETIPAGAAAQTDSELAERERRQRVLKKGIVSYNGGSITSEVIVRDLSSKGVKLKQMNQIPLPDLLTLEIPMDGIKVDCEVRWRNGDQLGVLFVSEPKIGQEAPRMTFSTSSGPATTPTLRKRPITPNS